MNERRTRLRKEGLCEGRKEGRKEGRLRRKEGKEGRRVKKVGG